MVSNKEYKIPQVRLSYVADYSVEHPKMMSSKAAADFIRSTYDDGEIDYREIFNVVFLNIKNKIIGFQTVSEGGTDKTLVDVKMIFAGALLSNAHSIIISHNHPSGELIPSPQDISLTEKIVKSGEVLDIAVIDHIIVTRDSYYSFRDDGRI